MPLWIWFGFSWISTTLFNSSQRFTEKINWFLRSSLMFVDWKKTDWWTMMVKDFILELLEVGGLDTVLQLLLAEDDSFATWLVDCRLGSEVYCEFYFVCSSYRRKILVTARWRKRRPGAWISSTIMSTRRWPMRRVSSRIGFTTLCLWVASYSLWRKLTLSLPVTHICINFSTVYNDTLVVKGIN